MLQGSSQTCLCTSFESSTQDLGNQISRAYKYLLVKNSISKPDIADTDIYLGITGLNNFNSFQSWYSLILNSNNSRVWHDFSKCTYYMKRLVIVSTECYAMRLELGGTLLRYDYYSKRQTGAMSEGRHQDDEGIKTHTIWRMVERTENV